MRDKIIQELNSNLKETRLSGMKKIFNLIQKREEQFKKTEEMNNHMIINKKRKVVKTSL